MNDLEEDLTDDLVRELFKRFDQVVFAGFNYLNEKTGEHITVRRWEGNQMACAGLAASLQAAVIEDWHASGGELSGDFAPDGDTDLDE